MSIEEGGRLGEGGGTALLDVTLLRELVDVCLAILENEGLLSCCPPDVLRKGLGSAEGSGEPVRPGLEGAFIEDRLEKVGEAYEGTTGTCVLAGEMERPLSF